MSKNTFTIPAAEATLVIHDQATAETAIRHHATVAQRSGRVTTAALVALGASLRATRQVLGYQHGGSRISSCSDSNLPQATEPATKRLPWPKLAATLTGRSYEWANQLTKASDKLIARLSKSEDPTHQAAAKILAQPPVEWTEESYLGLADVIAGQFDASTFTGLLEELGILAPSKPYHPGQNLDGHRGGRSADDDAGDDEDGTVPALPHRDTAADAAIIAKTLFRQLFTLRETDKERHILRLQTLPLRADDLTQTAGLLDLEEELEEHLRIIRDVKAARENTPQKGRRK